MPSVEKFTNNTIVTANAIDESETGYIEGTHESLTYTKWSTHISISSFNKSATEVVILSEIEGLPVTTIKNKAFYQYSYLTSVIIPDNVTSIGNDEFVDCENLTSIKILNLECYIHNISHYDDSYEKTIFDIITIYDYENSISQSYAEKFGNEFISLGEVSATNKNLK